MVLADTSAWIWSRRAGGELRQWFDDRLVEGEIATCDMVRLELLYSARSAGEFESLGIDLGAVPDCPIGKDQWQRALGVYGQLAQEGGGLHHRSVRHPDLLIAAAAEATGLTVLHYDEDYDRIAGVTAQRTSWIAPRGSLA